MRVLGIDPGTYKMGLGVVETEGGEFFASSYTVLTSKRNAPLSNRLHQMFSGLLAFINDTNPTVVAIEEPFAGKNIRSALAIGQAQAVALMAAGQHKLPVTGYAPTQIKQAVTDYGHSTKDQVAEMVKILLNLQETPNSLDVTDALAVAICHVNSTNIQNLVITE